MQMTMKKTVGALSIAGLSLGLASCGEETPESVALENIQDAMWDSMEASDSVRVTVNAPETGGEPSAEQTEAMIEAFGADFEEMAVYGAMDSSATAVSMGAADQTDEVMRIFDETVFMSTDFILTNLGAQMEFEEQDVQDRLAAVQDDYTEGWLNVPLQSAGAEGMTPAELISEMRSGWEAGGEGEDDEPVTGPMDSENLSAEGQLEERDGQEVWVFSSEDNEIELVVEADEEAPRILSASDGEVSMIFSDWDTATLPDQPSDEEIVDENEFNDRILEIY